MQKLNVVFSRIYQGLIEIRVTRVKSCHMDLSTNVTIVINFLQDQTNKQHMEHCSGVRVLFTILTIKSYRQLFRPQTKKDVCCIIRYNINLSSKIKNEQGTYSA